MSPMTQALDLEHASIDRILAFVWQQLDRGVADRRSEYRQFSIATVGADLSPRVRTVVLRDADPRAWRLGFQSDLRAAKIGELEHNPSVEALFWSERLQLQIRARGLARIAGPDCDDAHASYARIPEAGRVRYRVEPAPGHQLASDADVTFASVEQGNDPGLANFAAVSIDVERFDVLYLGPHQRRAVFERGAYEAVSGRWIVP